jgi:preprotein translocase subunit SecY
MVKRVVTDPQREPTLPSATRAASSAGLARRLAVTVLLVLLVVACERIPLPGFDRHAPAFPRDFEFGLLALGLTPFLSAFLVVELIAAAVPALRWRRRSGPRGRGALVRSAVLLGIAFAAFQGWGIASYLESVGAAGARPLDRILIIASLGAGSAALLAVAGWIGRHGVGDGFAVLLSAQWIVAFWKPLPATARATTELYMVLLILPIAWVMFALVRALHANESDAVGRLALRLRHPASGLVPVGMAIGLLNLSSALVGYFPSLGRIADLARPGSHTYLALLFVGIVPLAFLFARLFHGPGAVAAVWSRVPGVEPVARETVKPLLRLGAIRAATFLTLLALLPALLYRELGLALNWTGAVVGLTLAVATVADLWAEWSARGAHRDLVAVWAEPSVHAADAITAALRSVGIAAWARGIHYRTLTRFFAPWTPIVIHVPRDRTAEAEAIAAQVATGA